MSKFIDLTGQRFGRLVALEHFRKNGRTYWHCRCDCGNETDVEAYNLKKITRSCGCIKKEKCAKMGKACRKHGMHHTRLYIIWTGMKARCTNPNAANYADYGGRGISVCDEWKTFEPFLRFATANGYHDSLTIDRIDVNGNYEPENVRFISNYEQQSNRRNNHLIIYNGQEKTLTQWANTTGIGIKTLQQRLSHGWTIEEALTIPAGGKRPNK